LIDSKAASFLVASCDFSASAVAYWQPNKLLERTGLEQLAEKGMVFIQEKVDEWLVECVRRDEYGFLVGRVCVWGENLDRG
jgi:hypothetical protein